MTKQTRPDAKDWDRSAHLFHTYEARNRLFGDHLFARDTWDILLYLHAPGPQRSDLDIRGALGLSSGTAQRWILALEHEGLVERAGSSIWRLSPRARRSMETVLAG